jgi:hypothetical protein
MAKFYVEMRIDFSGEVEADTADQAEQLAWESWGESMDSPITYAGVYSIEVEELAEDEEDEDEEE